MRDHHGLFESLPINSKLDLIEFGQQLLATKKGAQSALPIFINSALETLLDRLTFKYLSNSLQDTLRIGLERAHQHTINFSSRLLARLCERNESESPREVRECAERVNNLFLQNEYYGAEMRAHTELYMDIWLRAARYGPLEIFVEELRERLSSRLADSDFVEFRDRLSRVQQALGRLSSNSAAANRGGSHSKSFVTEFLSLEDQRAGIVAQTEGAYGVAAQHFLSALALLGSTPERQYEPASPAHYRTAFDTLALLSKLMVTQHHLDPSLGEQYARAAIELIKKMSKTASKGPPLEELQKLYQDVEKTLEIALKLQAKPRVRAVRQYHYGS